MRRRRARIYAVCWFARASGAAGGVRTDCMYVGKPVSEMSPMVKSLHQCAAPTSRLSIAILMLLLGQIPAALCTFHAGGGLHSVSDGKNPSNFSTPREDDSKIVSHSGSNHSKGRLLEPPPLFRQCDPRWGKAEMGTKGDGEQSTICREGCAMVRSVTRKNSVSAQ